MSSTSRGGWVLRAWVTGHRGLPAAVGLVLLTCGTAVYADLELPSLMSTAPVPVRGLFPPTLAVVVGATAGSRLPSTFRRSQRMVLARTAWALGWTGAAWGAAELVAGQTSYPPLVRESVVLVGLTLGASCLVGRWCVVPGLAIDAAVATQGADSRFVGLGFWYDGLPLEVQAAGLAVAVAGWICYAVAGPRPDAAHAAADG